MKKKVEYLYQPEYGGLYKVEGPNHYWYDFESEKWLKDEYDSDDVYFYRNNIEILTEDEANELIKKLKNDAGDKSSK